METMPYHHAVIGDVDVKIKVVAAGCPGEAVTVHCSRSGHHLPWNAESELQAREILSWVQEKFNGKEYKRIPVPTQHGIGLKVHFTHAGYPAGVSTNEPDARTLEIFQTIRTLIDEKNNGERIFVRYRATSEDGRASAKKPGSIANHAFRRELARIISSGGHVDTKVNDIVRLMNS